MTFARTRHNRSGYPYPIDLVAERASTGAKAVQERELPLAAG